MAKDYIKCPYCGRILPPDTVYCDQCHNEVAEHKKAIFHLIGSLIVVVILIYCGFIIYGKINAPKEEVVVKTTLDPNSAEVQAFLKKYSKDVQDKINANWQKDDFKSNYKAIITFRIAPDGYVISKQVTLSSGNEAFDATALYAIEKASPFGHIPPEYAKYIDSRHIFQTTGYRQE